MRHNIPKTAAQHNLPFVGQADISPSLGQPQSEIDMARRAASAAYDRLARCPELQAEAIARHYTTLAPMAAQLLYLIEAQASSEACRMHGDVAGAIAHCVNEIKRNHRFDFGLELAWPI